MGGFFDSLYSQFLLRDLLAKVIPGFVSLAALGSVFIHRPLAMLHRLKTGDSLLALAVTYGVSFMVALFLQFIGERLRFLVIYPWPPADKLTSKQVSLDKAREFLSLESVSPASLRQRERFAILKEMTGNFGMSVLAITLALLVRAFAAWQHPQVQALVAVPFLLVFAYLLFRQNRHHSDEQLIWERGTLQTRRGTRKAAP